MQPLRQYKSCTLEDEQLAYDALLEISKPKPHLTGSQWADSYRVIAPATSPEPGRWRTSRVPYLREPLDMATDHSEEKVVIMAASQVAKSELLINALGYYIDQEPSSIMMIQPTVEASEAFSKERIDPTFVCTPALAKRMMIDPEKGRSRKTQSTIRMKHFVGGFLAMVGSNSPSGLASRPIRVLLCDEIDRYGSTQEGDPLKLARQRTQNFHNRKIVMVSTPTTEIRGQGPTIYQEFLNTDQREYMLLCPHCSKRYLLAWSNVKWDKDSEGEVIDDSIRMECPECGAKVRGNGKPNPYDMAQGEWIAQKPDNIVKGYHLTSLASPWVSLTDLVHEFVAAKRANDMRGLQEFINLKLGEPWREAEADRELWQKLSDRREWYSLDTLPTGILLLTCGVDVQHDRLEASVYGFGEKWETWGVCHRIILGDTSQPAPWADLDAFLLRIFKTSDGKEMRIGCTFIDSGDGRRTDTVYEYVSTREDGRVYAIKGQGGESIPLINRSSTTNRYKIHLITLGVDGGKKNLLHSLKIRDVGPGFHHYSRAPECGHDETFLKQLTCEIWTVHYVGSRLKGEWIKVHGERNEAEDCAVYARAAAEVLQPDFAFLKAQRDNVVVRKTAPKKKRSAVLSSIE